MKSKGNLRGALRLLAILMALASVIVLMMGMCGCGGEEEASGDYSERNSSAGEEYVYDNYVNLEEDFTYDYVLNNNTMKFHYPDCSSVEDIKEKNKEYSSDSREEIIEMGYDPCKRCCP